ncbi:hypothetical protein PBI_DEWDROP_130 [Microbacterium phage Dewdrop]|nr:hypothetical protein PBI_LEAF_130 [Microbacterium phage Leaf]QGZ17498.1 hypothetical protein PBI_DEWDROP_130 [Microbacterium phage Dewdrop]
MSRPLEVRLQEYLNHGRRTAEQLLLIANTMDERFPTESQTAELRATAKVQQIVADDLEKLLRGEELQGWKIEGVIPE